jgi:hypothetical protein
MQRSVQDGQIVSDHQGWPEAVRTLVLEECPAEQTERLGFVLDPVDSKKVGTVEEPLRNSSVLDPVEMEELQTEVSHLLHLVTLEQ